MTGHEYLLNVLNGQKMVTSDLNTLRAIREQIEGVLRKAYGYSPRIYYAGSYGKKTMIKAAYDLDIVIYFPSTVGMTLRDLYRSVEKTLKDNGYKTFPKTVSIQLFHEGGFHVDVVPGRAQDNTYYYATLYKNGENSTMQTSIKKHIDSISESEAREIIKLVKLWRTRHSLAWKSFAVEQTVIRALSGQRKDDYEQALIKVFEFINNKIETIRLVDPANTNNVIEISPQQRRALKQASTNAINARYWSEVVW